MKRRIILSLIILFPLLVLWWLFNHSIIHISVAQPGSGTITYSLVNQSSHKTTTITGTSPNVSRLVARGSYEVSVSQQGSSSFTVAKTSSFLRKTSIDSKLITQPDRQFVGNNPQGCMYYLQNTLYSYDCAGATTRTTHVPATAITPTYNLKNIDDVFGSVEGIVNTQKGLVAVFQSNSTPHIAYSLTGTVQANQGVPLKDLDPAKTYKIASYKQGFLAYDSSFSDIRYYESIHAAPQTINITKPSDKSQQPLLLSASSSTIVVAYSDKAGFQENSDPKAIGKVKDTVFVYSGGKTQEFTFDKQYSSITACGTNKLCLAETVSKRLSVYDISGDTPQFLYAIGGANTIQNSGQNLLVVRNQDILSLDIDTYGGSMAYSFGDYRYCGLQNDGANYLLCLTDKEAKNVVLRMTPGTADVDNIGQKVSGLESLPEVTSVSAYGSYIFVSPNVGDLVYNSAANIYSYNPAVVRSVNAKIDAKIKSLNIDKSRYTVISTVK